MPKVQFSSCAKIKINKTTNITECLRQQIRKFILARVHLKVIIVQYKSKETPQLIGQFSPNLVITNFMQCFLYGPIG